MVTTKIETTCGLTYSMSRTISVQYPSENMVYWISVQCAI